MSCVYQQEQGYRAEPYRARDPDGVGAWCSAERREDEDRCHLVQDSVLRQPQLLEVGGSCSVRDPSLDVSRHVRDDQDASSVLGDDPARCGDQVARADEGAEE